METNTQLFICYVLFSLRRCPNEGVTWLRIWLHRRHFTNLLAASLLITFYTAPFAKDLDFSCKLLNYILHCKVRLISTCAQFIRIVWDIFVSIHNEVFYDKKKERLQGERNCSFKYLSLVYIILIITIILYPSPCRQKSCVNFSLLVCQVLLSTFFFLSRNVFFLYQSLLSCVF